MAGHNRTFISNLFAQSLRLLSAGVREDALPSERSKIYITKGASLFLVVLSPVFIGLNYGESHLPLALFNLASAILGAVCLFLLRKKFVQAAAVLLLIAGNTIFFFSALLFHNGMEYTLLLGMLGAVFMFQTSSARFFFVALSGLGFLLVKILHYEHVHADQLPLPRFAANLFIFLVSYYLILEIFRTVNRNYQREIEAKNSDLAESRSRLDAEHEELLSRTNELHTANRAKERLFSILAHDLRSPIGSIKSALDLMDNDTLTRSDFQAVVADLKVDVDVAYECLDTLLVWSAQQLREIKPIFTDVSLEKAARENLALFEEVTVRKGISIHNAIPVGARVRADEVQVSSIFRNLISNALKFTAPGGSVEISATNVGTDWRVTVSDTGVGMTQEQVLQLLNSADISSTSGTNNERGFGLGTKICRDFIRSNHGSFSIDSQVGKGSNFHFTLPAA